MNKLHFLSLTILTALVQRISYTTVLKWITIASGSVQLSSPEWTLIIPMQ